MVTPTADVAVVGGRRGRKAPRSLKDTSAPREVFDCPLRRANRLLSVLPKAHVKFENSSVQSSLGFVKPRRGHQVLRLHMRTQCRIRRVRRLRRLRRCRCVRRHVELAFEPLLDLLHHGIARLRMPVEPQRVISDTRFHNLCLCFVQSCLDCQMLVCVCKFNERHITGWG